MRSLRLLTALALAMIGFNLAHLASAQSETWDGKTVFIKKNNTKIGQTDDQGRQIELATLTELHYRVLAERDGWIKVKARNGIAGWFDKNDAVVLEDAVAYFTDYIRANPKHSDAYRCRAIAWQFKGEFDIAIRDMDEAVRLDPKSHTFHSRGNLLKAKKEYEKALADYSEALRLDPKEPIYYVNRGNTWRIQKEHDKAITDLSEAIRLDPNYVWALESRGHAWLGKKDYDKAVADYSEAIRLDPNSVNAYYARGWTRNKMKQYDKALLDYTEVVRLDPKHVCAFNGLAWILATCPDEKIRDGKRAISLAKQALELSKNDAYFMDTLAAAHAEVGNFDEAVRLQELALKDSRLATNVGAQFRLQLYRRQQAYRDGAELDTVKLGTVK